MSGVFLIAFKNLQAYLLSLKNVKLTYLLFIGYVFFFFLCGVTLNYIF